MNLFLTHNILKLFFIEIYKFKKKKILEEDEYDSNDQWSDAEATGNEGNLNNCLICFSSVFQKLQCPGEGYIRSGSSPTWVTYQHAANQENSLKVIIKWSIFKRETVQF